MTRTIFGILFMFVSIPVLANASESKVGIFNMQQVILSVEEGKAALKRLEGLVKEKEGELSGQKKELEKLDEDWKKNVSLLSEDAKVKKQQEFQTKLVALRNEEMKFREEIKRREAEASQAIIQKTNIIVLEMGQDRDFFAIFESNSGVIYLKNPIDLTNEIIVEYNKRHPIGVAKADTKSKSRAKK